VPALPAAPNVIRIELGFAIYTTHGATSRFYMQYTGGPPSDGNLNTLASDVSTAWASTMAAAQYVGVDLIEITCTDLSTPTSAIGTWSGSVAGTLSGTPLPVEICGNLHSVIARRYRGGRPKLFIPMGITASLAGDETSWSTAFISDVNGYWAAFKTALFALTGIGCTLTEHVNVSYYEGFASVQNPVTKRWRNIPTPRTGDAVIDTITATTLQTLISQQRRRRVEAVP